MKLTVSAVCKQGGREYNQDAYSIHLSDNSACLVVCDGLGAYFGSEIASSMAAESVKKSFVELAEKNPSSACDKKSVLNYIEKAHKLIHTTKEDNLKIVSSCTTIAVFATVFQKSVCAHIGDSRIYIFRDGKLSFYTTDHSMAQFAVEQKLISRNEIRNHPDQNKLTRVLGSEYYTAPDVNYMDNPLQAGDVVILCTDGFWEYVYENEMEEDLAKSLTPESALEKMEKRLLKRASKHNDNYTAIVAYISE